MLPLTDEQLKHRAEFNTFLLDGFIDVRQLEEAIYEQNPDLRETEKAVIANDLDKFQKLLTESSTSSSIVSELVIVNKDQMPFLGQSMRWGRPVSHDIVPKPIDHLSVSVSDITVTRDGVPAASVVSLND